MSLIQMSVSGAVMILVITAVRAISINRLPKKTFAVLWGLVLVRLLVPFSLPSPFSVYSLAGHSGAGQIGTSPIANVLPVDPVSAGTAAAHNTAVSAGISVWGWTWGIGLVLCILYFTAACIRCRRKFMVSEPVENDFTIQWLTEYQLRRPVSIRQSGKITAPLTYGILHPVILMPAETDWTETMRMQYVLAHEYVHIRRFGAVTKLLLTAALCLHWCNPLVWVMYLLANRDIELSCDERVVRMFGETVKSAYALMLIAMEEKKSGLTPLCSNFSKNAVEERIEAIMKIKKTTVFSIAAACAVVAVIGSAFATSAAAESIQDLIYVKEDIAVRFLPDPGIYEQYSPYEIGISGDGQSLLYKNQKVKLFTDSNEKEAFYYDEAGTVNLKVERDSSGAVTGVSVMSEKEAQKCRAKFFEEDTDGSNQEPLENGKKYEQYASFGISFRAEEDAMYFKGQKVRVFVDESDGWYPAFWTDETGTADLAVTRNSSGQITGIETLPEEKAERYLAAAGKDV